MHLSQLQGKSILILGTGREAQAAAEFIAPLPFKYADDASGALELNGVSVARGDDVLKAINEADIIIKSPGISLYDPRLKGANVTSLMNLWFANNVKTPTLCLTATKGKSTSSTLLFHVLQKLGVRAALHGNIGTPLCKSAYDADIVVVEVSSYQAADFTGVCDIAVLLNLYEDHLDWHGSKEQYKADKLSLLSHAKKAFISEQALRATNYKGDAKLIAPPVKSLKNPYLARAHNAQNAAAVLAITSALGLNDSEVLKAMEDFRGLIHRQYELGEKNGVLYVDDSISTTPAASVAALEAYASIPKVLIAGGHDRGVDYTPLIEGIISHNMAGVICLGASGERIFQGLKKSNFTALAQASNMQEAVLLAQRFANGKGAILLSPAAPSFGMFTDFQARGQAFAKAAGFNEG